MRTRVGDLRPSQLIFTYGVGATIELPHITGIVMGLEEWDTARLREISEERVLLAVRGLLGPQVEKLCSPPLPTAQHGPNPLSAEDELVGVPVGTYPTWLRCPRCNTLAAVTSGLFELKPNRYRPDRTCYVHTHCTKVKPGESAPVVVPARFMAACEHGHYDDFPWVEYLHEGVACPAPKLRIQELGVSDSAAEVILICGSCGKKRSMAHAFGKENREKMPECRGRRPHLRDYEERSDGKACDEKMKAMLLGASNSWFPLTVSALYVPSAVDKLMKLVEANWLVLQKAASLEVLVAFRAIGQLADFGNHSDQEIFKAIETRRSNSSASELGDQDVKLPEWQVFSNPDPARNTRDFQLREVPPPRAHRSLIKRVVLAERLREVRALIGFTRIESPGDFGETLEVPEDRRMPISRAKPRWVPASEVRGEGVFLEFDEEALSSWLRGAGVLKKEPEFRVAHRRWREKRNIPNPDAGFPGMRYVLLHSFSHALMRQIALECGYTAASIRERIYSRSADEVSGPQAGVLIYTAAPDSEGTLGGLVALGEPANLDRHVTHALEGIRLCAADPLCAEHVPHLEPISLHGAACHACLFSPETSCERGNRYLDRNVLVESVNALGISFFGCESR